MSSTDRTRTRKIRPRWRGPGSRSGTVCAVTTTTTQSARAPAATLLDAVAEECGWNEPEQLATVEDVLDALVGMAVLVLPDRWNEDCHRCERHIGDHTMDGRCPA